VQHFDTGYGSIRYLPAASMRVVAASVLVVFLFVCSTRARKPELVVETGHSHAVLSVAFSPDGRTLASGSGDYSIKLWDVASSLELRALPGHTVPVLSVAFSPDSRTLAPGSSDNTIKLWDVANGLELRSLTGHAIGVGTIAFSSDGLTWLRWRCA
jgi:WD40 repeat protein